MCPSQKSSPWITSIKIPSLNPTHFLSHGLIIFFTKMTASWYFLASSLFLKRLFFSPRIRAVWGQGPHLSCSEVSITAPPPRCTSPCPVTHSWYAKYISWIKEIKLCQHYPDSHWSLPRVLPTVTAGKESVSLIARWISLIECSARPAEKRRLKREFLLWRKHWPENLAFWVVWVCGESPDFWLKIFILILVFFLIWYIYHLSLFGSAEGATAMSYDMNRDHTLHFPEHFAFWERAFRAIN